MGSHNPEIRLSSDKKEHSSKDVASCGVPGKNFQQRVEEFSMWKDEGTFLEMEYKRRRDEKKKMRGTIRSDSRLILSKRLYIPVISLLLAGVLVLLISSLEGLGKDSILWKEQRIFQILGALLLFLGLLGLMVVAAYSYHREDKVRAKFGYPSLFMSSLKGETSTKNMEETIMLQHTFLDRPRHYSRMNSVESRCSNNNLGNSFSSTSTAMSWVHKHRDFNAQNSCKCSLRRENSDSALDKIFARNRLISWEMEEGSSANAAATIVVGVSGGNSEQIENNSCDSTKERKVGDVSQIESCVSMASSGYCSNTSTHCLSQSNRRTLSRHLSEPSKKVTVHYTAKRDRMLSEGIIPDEESFEEHQQRQHHHYHHQEHFDMSSIPIINIECV